jgi:rare lipoprotein A
MRRVLPCFMATLLFVVTVGAAPATKGPRSTKSGTPKAEKPPYEIGKASWYGKPFHGRTTASGEPYDMFQFTAAHRYLPLGTWLRVTNLRNGRWVMVRVNDRGPVPENRIIDLSYGAATVLDFQREGIERVRLDIVTPQMVAASQEVGGE